MNGKQNHVSLLIPHLNDHEKSHLLHLDVGVEKQNVHSPSGSYDDNVVQSCFTSYFFFCILCILCKM